MSFHKNLGPLGAFGGLNDVIPGLKRDTGNQDHDHDDCYNLDNDLDIPLISPVSTPLPDNDVILRLKREQGGALASKTMTMLTV